MGSPTRKLCYHGALALGDLCLESDPAEAHSCWDYQGQLGAWGAHPLRSSQPVEWLSWRERGGTWLSPRLACSERQPLPEPCRAADRCGGHTCPGGNNVLPPTEPPGGNSGYVGDTKRAALLGRRLEESKLGTGRSGAQVPFHAVGPAAGAQTGRTAATQAVYVHIQFITFIENRKPHT